MDLLRLAGAPGVGKSTLAWAVAQRWATDGVATGYVDIDQLGMRYPASEDDPDRWELKERALAGVAEEFSRHGVDRLVVSGVAWPDEPPPRIRGVATQSLWLDAAEQTRRARLAVRGLGDEQLGQVLSAGTTEADRVHAAWARLGTDELSEAEALAEVLGWWKPATAGERTTFAPVSPTVPGADRILWITGPRLAGASRLGWEIVSREWSEGRRAGFMDLAQLSFTWNVDTAVGLANLARLHGEFRAVGTERFVIVAPIDVDPAAVRAALPTSEVSFVRLAPSVARLRTHAVSRRRRGGPSLAGDDILGATDAAIERILRIAHSQSSLPAREHELIVETHELSLAREGSAVRRAAGW